jgi:hypothetical protein
MVLHRYTEEPVRPTLPYPKNEALLVFLFPVIQHHSGHHNNSSAFNFKMNGFCQF